MIIVRCIMVVMLLGVAGCSRQIERSMLIGKYVANHKKGIDVLELKPDGTYTYFYQSDDGKKLTNSNQWEFRYQDGEPRITFSKFVFGLPGYGTKEPGFWDVKVEKSFGKIKLCIDPDLRFYYIKQ